MASGVSRDYVALDLETTGLLASSDRIVELGAVRFDGKGRETGRFERLVNPGRRMPRAAHQVHGIGDEDLVDAPPIGEVLPAFMAFLGDPGGTRLLAHNASFDAGFLGTELARCGHPECRHEVTDTLALARRRLVRLSNHRLDTLSASLGLSGHGSHRALADSLRVKELWLALGGPEVPDEELVTYPVSGSIGRGLIPVAWAGLADAIERGWIVRMAYSGGTRGTAPRDVTPRAVIQRGGMSYLVAFCHLDAQEKSFRLDRVLRYEIIRSRPTSSPPNMVSF
jgi:DNA polymerase III epsilon subunit family exonuclease